MAWQYVGGASGVGTSNGYAVSLTGLTGGIGSAPQAGDIVVVCSAFGNTASSAPAVSGNNSGAYTAAHAAIHSNDTWDTEFRSFYMVQGSTPDTSLTITRVANAAYGGGTVVQVWRGVDQTTPLDVTPTTASGGNASTINAPAITPLSEGSLIIACGAGTQGTTGSAFTVPSGMTNGVSINADGSTSDIGVMMASYAWTSGAYDPAAVTGGTTSTSSSWAAATIALRAAVDVTAVGQDQSGAYDVLTAAALDQSGSYVVLAAVGQDQVDAYSTVQAIGQDQVDGYAVLQAAGLDQVGGYLVVSPAGADQAGGYAVVQAIGQDATGSYGVTSAVDADGVGAYAVAAAVGADLAESYFVAGAVGTDYTGNFVVVGTVGADLAGGYSTLAAAGSDVAGAYLVLSAVGADVGGDYACLAAVGADAAMVYGVAAVAGADVGGGYGVAGAVGAGIGGGYAVLAPAAADVEDSYSVLMAEASDQVDGYQVFCLVSEELLGTYSLLSDVMLTARAPDGSGHARLGERAARPGMTDQGRTAHVQQSRPVAVAAARPRMTNTRR